MNKCKIKNIILQTLLTLYSFLYIFSPNLPVVSFPKHLTITSIIILTFILFNKNYKCIEIKPLKNFIFFIPFFIYFYISFSLRLSLTSNSLISLNILHITLVFIHIWIGIVFISTLIKNSFITYKQFIDSIVYSGLIQFIFVILAFIFPKIREFFQILIFLFSKSETNMLATLKTNEYRGFGFADSLFDSFGYRLSLVYIVSFSEYMESKNKFYLFSSLFIFFASLLNARTGVLLSIISTIIILVFYFPCLKLKRIVKFTFISLMLLLIVIPIVLNYLPERVYEWQAKGLNDTYILLSELKIQGVYYDILKDDIVIPNNYVFGEGGLPGCFGYEGLDNGYIKELWFFGIIGLILFNLAVVLFFLNIILHRRNIYSKTISICFIVTYMLFLIKLYPLSMGGSNYIIYSIPLLANVKSKREFEYQ